MGPEQDLIEGSRQIHPIQRTLVKFERGHVRVGERIPGRLGLPVGNDLGDDPVAGHGGDRNEQGSKDGEAAHG